MRRVEYRGSHRDDFLTDNGRNGNGRIVVQFIGYDVTPDDVINDAVDATTAGARPIPPGAARKFIAFGVTDMKHV
ncbi:MAG: hypothetical protein JWR75_362 [Devosia sp.]|nr:hypothetical protein [Devosia sp.]